MVGNAAAGAAMGVSTEQARQYQNKGIQALRKRRRALEDFIDRETPFYWRVGVDTFTRTNTSSVEDLVLRRERLREKMNVLGAAPGL